MDKVYLTVDLGGTRIRAALCRADGTIEARTEQFTRAEEGANAVVERIAESLRVVWPAKGKVASIGVGVPGPVDPFTGVIFLAPNIPGFVNLPLRDWLQAISKCRSSSAMTPTWPGWPNGAMAPRAATVTQSI